MQSRIAIGGVVITIHQGDIFMVTAEDGEISPERELGLFCCDTRLISSYQLLLDGQRWTPATAAPLSYYGACYYLVSPQLHPRRQSLAERMLEPRLERATNGGEHEDFDLMNNPGEHVALTADVTVLFLILLSEAYRWIGDERIVRAYRGTALRCREWIDRYGDLDGDDFQEYRAFSAGLS